jgi:hypothetical protein
VPNYGEFVEVYYNKDAFAAAGLEVPTTLDEFEDVLQAFADQGITPLSESAAEYPLGQLWYQLALSKATARSSTTTSSTRATSTGRATRSRTPPRRSRTGPTRATSRPTRAASRPRTPA